MCICKHIYTLIIESVLSFKIEIFSQKYLLKTLALIRLFQNIQDSVEDNSNVSGSLAQS